MVHESSTSASASARVGACAGAGVAEGRDASASTRRGALGLRNFFMNIRRYALCKKTVAARVCASRKVR